MINSKKSHTANMNATQMSSVRSLHMCFWLITLLPTACSLWTGNINRGVTWLWLWPHDWMEVVGVYEPIILYNEVGISPKVLKKVVSHTRFDICPVSPWFWMFSWQSPSWRVNDVRNGMFNQAICSHVGKHYVTVSHVTMSASAAWATL